MSEGGYVVTDEQSKAINIEVRDWVDGLLKHLHQGYDLVPITRADAIAALACDEDEGA